MLPPDKSLLKHILSVGDGSQHAVGNGEEQASILIERSQTDRNFWIGQLLVARNTEIAVLPHQLIVPPQGYQIATLGPDAAVPVL